MTAILDERLIPPPTEPVVTEVLETLPRSILRLFWLFARPFMWTVISLMVASICLRVIGVAQVYATKMIVDTAVALDGNFTTAWQQMVTPLALFIGLIALSMVVEWGAWFSSYNGRIPILARARQLIFNYVHRHPTSYFDNMLTGKVAYRAMLLPEQTVSVYERTNWDYLPLLVQCIALLVVFFTVQPLFALVLLLWLAVYATVAIRMGKYIAKFGAAHSDAKAQLTGRIVDSITNIKNVIFFAAHDREEDLIGRSVGTTFIAQRQSYLAYVKMRVCMQFLHIAIYGFIFTFAIRGLIAGSITVGDFVLVATLTLNLVRNVFDTSNYLPETLDWIGSIRDSLDMLVVRRDIIDKPSAADLTVLQGEIAFENVSFVYDNNKQVFAGLDLTIAPGQRVGLIGHSGAGKTTLATLLMRLYDVQGGRIAIDGQNIANVTQDSLRRSIGLIPQDTILFHRSLLDNIRYGRPDASDDEVVAAAQRAPAHEFIMTLPEGYNTKVGERGVKLSGGQRQRIAIARALLKNAPILILDEATSALDSESEALIQAGMSEAMAGKTVIAIAHRLSTIAHLDRLVVLEHGKVVEDGSHGELLAKGGIYADLWARQSGGFLRDDGAGPTGDDAE
jgi:ABC-type multidrug transport system fused ATPase/permease subunit